MTKALMEAEEGNTSLPRCLKKFGTKEAIRDYLGDLIHALRSHIPCVYLRPDHPLWCDKIVPCLRLSYRWTHMHHCLGRKDCKDEKCPYAWKLISHWYYCRNENCFVCSPWVKPTSLHGQSRTFLNDIFERKPILASYLSSLLLNEELIRRTQQLLYESDDVPSDDEKNDSKSTDFEIDIRPTKMCVSQGVQADLEAPEFGKVPIQRNNVRKGFCIRHRHKKSKKVGDNAVFVIAEKDSCNQVAKWDVAIQVDLPIRSKSVKLGKPGRCV
nr:Zinc finger domain containing protein [Haemonchus contortus]